MMNGAIALLGSGAYLDTLNDLDRQLLSETNCARPRVVCVPTAATQFGAQKLRHYIRISREHFQLLDVKSETALITDRVAANQPRWVELLKSADLIYFSGGNPFYLYHTLTGTAAWQAIVAAWQQGAALAGSSAGAMILGQPNKLPEIGLTVVPAFGLVPQIIVWPHFDLHAVKRPLTNLARPFLPDRWCALGIDEYTGLVGRIGGEWSVRGAGSVKLLTPTRSSEYVSGSQLMLPLSDKTNSSNAATRSPEAQP
jgi:cyanophycinase